MSRGHPVLVPVAAAVIAAAVVLGAYALFHKDGSVKTAKAVAAAPVQAMHLEKPEARPAREGVPEGAPPPLPPAMLKNGQKPPKLPDNLPNPAEMQEQFAMLKRFLELSPERLEKIRQSIERIQQMPQARKEMMLEHIRESSGRSSSGKNGSVFSGASDAVMARINSMSADARKELAEKLSAYDEEQRTAFLEGMDQVEKESWPW